MKRKSAFSLILALATLFASCSNPSGEGVLPPVEVFAEDVEVWSAPGTEKVLQNQLTGSGDLPRGAYPSAFHKKIHLVNSRLEYV